MPRAGLFRTRVVIEREFSLAGASWSDAVADQPPGLMLDFASGTYLAEAQGLYDEYGNPDQPEWQPLLSFRGDLREVPGKEAIAAGRLEAPVMATLRLRQSQAALTITAADRVRARGHVWAIKSDPIDPTGRGQLLELTLERGAAI